MRTVLCNAGPLIALGKLNRLNLLADLYRTIHVPSAVYSEVVSSGSARGAPDALTVRLFIERYRCPVVEASAAVITGYSPPVTLDRGERELLALARSTPGALVLLDDEVARAEARRLGLPLLGTLGILVEAHRAGLIAFEPLELLLLEIGARPDIWISEKLCQTILAQLRP